MESAYHSDTVYDLHAGLHLVESQLGQCVAQQHQLQLIISRGMLFVEEIKSAQMVAVKFSPRSSNQLFEEIKHRLGGRSLVEIMNQPPSGNQKPRRGGRTGSKMSKDAIGNQKSYPETDQKVHLKGQPSKASLSRLPYSSKVIEGCAERIDRVGHYLEVFKELTSMHCQFLAEPQDASALVNITLENGTQPGTQQLAPIVSAAQSTAAGSASELMTYLSQEDRSAYRTDKFSLNCRYFSPSFRKTLQPRSGGSCWIEHLHGYASQKK